MAGPEPKLRDLFSKALLCQSAEEQTAYLAQACQGDAELRARLEELLHAHREAGSFLQEPSASRGATVDQLPASASPGTSIGPYKLLQEIGEGGMGTVFMAEQTHPIQRKIALKVIKAGMDSRQVIARFEAERQALAMMDHVNIARVLDAGTTDAGQPYFVMELVHGVPITKYCDDNHLTPRERLELFVPVCQAIQHAHQKGLIHRDLKPSNVMVTLYDGKPVPKVIDFGVAKATEQRLTERTLFTQYGTMVGTLEYMSPEQAEMSALGVDTRSDIYSLGVLLYELLTGSTPLSHKRLKDAAYFEILRMIREEEAPKPSTRLSDSGEALASISANRHTEPAKLTKLVRGELDWIVMKALEKDRNRRYETANGLARDIERQLHDKPVEACPPSVGYKLRKFVRRNKGPVLTALAILLLLVGGIVGTTLGLLRAVAEANEKEQARMATEANFQRTRQAVDEYFTLTSQSTLFDVPGLQPLRRELLEKAVRYYREMVEKRGDDPSVLAGLAVALLRLAQMYHEVNRNNDSIETTNGGLDVVERLRREHPSATEHHRKLAGYFKGMRRMEEWTTSPKDPIGAHRTLTRFANLWEKFITEIPDERAFESDLASVYDRLGEFESARSHRDQADDYYQKGIHLLERLHGDYPKDPRYRATLAMIFQHRLVALENARRPLIGEWANRMLALQEGLPTEFPKVPQYKVDLAVSLTGLGQRLASAGRKEEAAATFRRSIDLLNQVVIQFPGLANYSPRQADNVRGLLPLLKRVDQPKELETAFRSALDLYGKLVVDSPTEPSFRAQFTDCLIDMASFLNEVGQRAEAEKALNGAISHWEELIVRFPTYLDRWQLARSFNRLAEVLRAFGRFPEAETACRQALERFLTLAKEEPANIQWPYDVAWTARGLSSILHSLNRIDEAVQALRQSLEHLERVVLLSPQPMYQHDVLNLSVELGNLLTNGGRHKHAEVAYRRALDLSGLLLKDNAGNQGYRHAWIYIYRQLNCALTADGRPQEARKAGAESLRVIKQQLPAGGDSFGWFFLATAHWHLGNKEEARDWYDQAVAWMDKNQEALKKNRHGWEELSRFRAEAAELLEIKKK